MVDTRLRLLVFPVFWRDIVARNEIEKLAKRFIVFYKQLQYLFLVCRLQV